MLSNQILFNKAVRKSQKEIIKKLILEEDVDPSVDENFAIRHFIYINDYEMVNFFLKDKRVNAADKNSMSILLAIEKEYYDIVKLLWKNENVKKSLKNDNLDSYNYLTKKYLENNLNKF